LSSKSFSLNSFLKNFVAGLLIVQSLLSPMAQAQGGPPFSTEGFEAADPSWGESSDPTQPGSESDAVRDAEDLRKVIEGTSDRVRLRLDSYGFYDLLSDADFAKSGTAVPFSLIKVSTRDDRHF